MHPAKIEWEAVIGLEVHVQLRTKSKLFSGASTQFGAAPNTQACVIDLGLPGVLPVLNQAVVEMAIRFALGVNAQVAKKSVFARKNYFYPDLPKGYQISQYEQPIVQHGYLDIPLENGISKRIHITRAHLEEDAGKSLHEDFHGLSGIDLNRAGTPLLEIVSEPEMCSAKEAVAYLKTLHSLVRYLDICDGNMQEGSFRCDANVSIRPQGQKTLGIRAELKNINSFRFVERAINYEIERQISVLENNGHMIQETRLYDANKNETRSLRQKEEANDYRYFPDPDLLPIVIHDEMIARIQSELPELPQQKHQRFMQQYGLSAYDATILISSNERADYYEEVVATAGGPSKRAANWVVSELLGALNKAGLEIDASPIPATQLGKLVARIADHTISGKIAKTIFEALWQGQQDVDDIITQQGLKQVSDVDTIEKLIDEILLAHPQQVADYRAGKDKLLGFFVGLAMKASGGKLNPGQLNALLKKKLGS
jgi:aspartyl-tRNA(Asn)/glutamyl-tRNA(Gln) amidotransferase subunit B